MDNTRLIENALRGMARGSRQPFFDLLSEDVSWEWFYLERELSPVIGKEHITDSFMHGGAEAGHNFAFDVGYVYDRDEDEKIIIAELAGRGCASHMDCCSTYYTWSFDLVGGRVTHVRAYMDAC